MNRVKQVIKVSLIGVVTNLVLVAFKAFVGLVSGSISIISDALNFKYCDNCWDAAGGKEAR